MGKSRKSEKVGNQKKQEISKSTKSEKLEIGKIWKLENVGNQKKVGNKKKQEI